MRGYDEATQSSVIGVTADIWESFGLGLNNGGETLTLAHKAAGQATTTIDTVAVCAGGSTTWCAGDDTNYKTMERYDSLSNGDSTSNWYSHIGEFIQNGTDTNGVVLKGTPRARNSVSALIDPSYTLTANRTLSSTTSPYLVNRFGLTVPAGKTLTLEAGAVVKIVGNNEPWIRVQGTIIANGTAGSPVVFTSFLDDEYGGDMNADGGATTPAAGNWRRLFIETTSSGSTFTHTRIRYGGNNLITDDAGKQGAIGVSGATVSFDGLTVEKSGFHGLSLENSQSTVTNSRFATSTTASVNASGLFVSGGSPTIASSTFSGNYRGLTLESSPATLTGNTFTSNEREAVYTSGVLGSFSGNSGSGNLRNAIQFGQNTTITSSGATTTLLANSLPYLVRNKATVAANSTLSFGEGVVVKGYDTTGNAQGEIEVSGGGKIHSAGSVVSDLIFTSFRDSSVGGTVSTGLTSPLAGDWVGLTVKADGLVSLSGFTVKYAGQRATNPFYGESAGAFKITGSSAPSGSIALALFDTNYQSGLNLESVSSLTVSDSTFQNHTEKITGSATGLYSSGSTASFSTITFFGNEKDGVGTGTNTLACTSCTPASLNTTPANLFGL